MRVLLGSALALAITSTSTAGAQLYSAPTPSQADCRRAAAEWSASRRSKEFTPASAMIPYCGAFGDSVLASALRRSVSESDTVYLRELYGEAVQHRSPLLLAAAGAVAVDRNATLPARVTALLLVLGQYQPAMGFPPSVGYAELMGPTWPGCRITIYNDSPPPGPPQLPQVLRGVAQALDSLATSPSEPTQIRSLAECVARKISADSE
jgi:hypothetical protein